MYDKRPSDTESSQLLSRVFSVIALIFMIGFWNFNADDTLAKGTDRATREYNAALNSYNSAVSRLNAAERKTPSFYISGEITHRYSKEILIWGYATDSTASPSHPGWLTESGNIIIKNYKASNISYNKYYGRNYFIKQTTGVGLFGQEVPVNIYGPKPKKIAQLEREVNDAAKKLHEKKLKLPAEFSIQYKGKNVTDNHKHPLKLDRVPYTVSLINKSKGAESSSWYISTGKNKWKLISSSKNTKVDIKTEKATIKLVINHNKKNYKIHKVYISLPATGFTDIPKTHWAAHSIIKVTKAGLMKAFNDKKFHPNTAVTRGQFAKLIVQAYKIKPVNPAVASFSDVSKENQYYPCIEATKYYFKGTFSFSKNEKFNPNSKIRRDEAAAVITRLTLLDRQSLNGESFLKSRFTDYKKISPSLYKLVAIAVDKNLMIGYENNTFKGSSSLDRATAAYLLNQTSEKYYGKSNNVKFSSSIPGTTFKKAIPISMKLSGNAKVYLNNKQVTFYYGEYDQNYNLVHGEGTYHFNIKLVQPFRILESNKKVVYSIPAPLLKLNSLPVSTDIQSLTISGSVTDKTDDHPSIYINNQEVYIDYSGEWSESFDLSEGNNTFVIKAVNSSGKVTKVTKVVKFTPAIPALSVHSIPVTTSLDTVTISGKVTDKNDDRPRVYVNDREVYVSYDGTWSDSFDLSEGVNSFVIKAENTLGKTTKVTRKILFASDSPVLTVNSVAETTNLDSVTISGKVSDKNDDRPKVYVNDQEVYVSYDGSWYDSFDLSEGDNTFVIKAENSLGKISSVTKKVEFSPPVPVLTVNSVLSSTEYDSITISGKVSDKNDDRPRVYVNDQEVYVSYDGTWSDSFDLSEGDNTFVIKAENSLGKTSSVTKTVKFSPPVPVLTVNSVLSSTEYDSITISGKVSDKNDDRPKVYVNDQEVYVSYDGTWSDSFDLSEGDNTFVIKAENSLGKISSVTKVVKFIPPSPTLTVNTVPSTTTYNTITISGKVSDKNDDRPKVYINNQEVYVSYDGPWSKAFSLMSGLNTFEIKATNSLGKITSITRTITYAK
ncbi:S-layer homology domain-containing protein [Bacillus sp. UNC438CL73TsuS30]|uniref:S-layer homology domain-containing protein n=1 Tax=Bacillus sp. UNC438CL73TsuS30 TaxID=1340434 RepID=UPI0012DBD452|nr:S-layer homology domain-containing protein [Bacillus sp. UNC438CL73TsuS30]